MPKIPIGLQLYTVREDMERDFVGTIRKVADIGYAAVELAGHGSLSVRELSGLLEDNHLSVAGSHIGLDTLETDLPRIIDEALVLGNKHIVIPSLPEERRRTADDWKAVAETMSGIGETLQTADLTLCYHNHDFEFKPLADGQLGIDVLFAGADPLFVKAEVDTYWVMKAGLDPVAFVKKHTGRVPLMHLKDRDTSDGSFAPIGTGDLPLDALIAAASEIGTQYIIVEQDICKGPALEAAALSYNNLKTKGYA